MAQSMALSGAAAPLFAGRRPTSSAEREIRLHLRAALAGAPRVSGPSDALGPRRAALGARARALAVIGAVAGLVARVFIRATVAGLLAPTPNRRRLTVLRAARSRSRRPPPSRNRRWGFLASPALPAAARRQSLVSPHRGVVIAVDHHDHGLPVITAPHEHHAPVRTGERHGVVVPAVAAGTVRVPWPCSGSRAQWPRCTAARRVCDTPGSRCRPR